jgi:serine/threonine-protein kinase
MSQSAAKPPTDDEVAFSVLNAIVEDLQAGRQPDRTSLLEHAELEPVADCLELLEKLAPPAFAPPASAGERGIAEAATLVRTTSPDPSIAPSLPDLGKYELLEEIGRGGMGVVYKAKQKDLDRVVAIKMILAGSLASPDQVSRFVAEARAMARLHHPQVVRVLETGEFHGHHYLVMEHLSGPSLAGVLSSGPLAFERAASHVAQVARAVAYLHAQGIVHRDLKPSNILLDEQGRPCVTDFGLVKMVTIGAKATATGTILGTPAYMAPEQAARNLGTVGPQSDVYSLGAVLYESLTGRAPIQEQTPLDALVQVLEGEPPRPRAINPQIPLDLELVCLKCLEKAPEARYASAAAVADDLDHFLKGEEVSARRVGLGHRLGRWARREPALASRVAALAICFAIVDVNYRVFGTVTQSLHIEVLAILTLWALASVAFDQGLRRPRWAAALPYAWSLADVSLLTALLILTENWLSPLLVGYPLLIAASGLWLRVRLVWFTTAIAAAAYLLLVFGFSPYGISSHEPHHRLIFLVALPVLGFIIAYHVQRARALSRYYEQSPQ